MENHNPTAAADTFAGQVRAIPGGEYVDRCYSCGTCVSRCPVQQKLDEEYNPRRLLKMVMMEMREDAYEAHTTWLCSACDLCYPACPQEIHISGVITAVKKLAVEAGRQTFLGTALVNKLTCVACGLCVAACPYKAISLVESNVPNRGKLATAEVDAGLCMACGLCSAVCRSDSIELPGMASSEAIINDLRGWLPSMVEAA